MARAQNTVLVVDDEANIRKILQAALDRDGWHTLTAETGEAALAVLADRQVDCVLTDVTMPGMSGYDLQRQIAANWPEVPVVVMTAFGTIPQAIQAIRDGAFEFVTKPFDLDNLKRVVRAAAEPGRSARKSPARQGAPTKAFIAASPAMMQIVDTIRRVADSRATVLVTGESGTGKEVVARLIHDLSPRSAEAFVAVSCAALPESLMESELFGHEKGAFTGAAVSKPGRFELADNGTLFLDEIGDVPGPIQVKLLRVLQEREFERLGATRPTKVDVRLVTATNRDLQRSVDEGTFRLDLLYRLQVVEIALPPLRDRREDLMPLARHFLALANAEHGRELTEVAPEAEALLLAHHWPGNVRELENAMARAAVLAERGETVLRASHLPPALQRAA